MLGARWRLATVRPNPALFSRNPRRPLLAIDDAALQPQKFTKTFLLWHHPSQPLLKRRPVHLRRVGAHRVQDEVAVHPSFSTLDALDDVSFNFFFFNPQNVAAAHRRRERVDADQVLGRRRVVDLDGYFYFGGLAFGEERGLVVVGVVGVINVRGVVAGCASGEPRRSTTLAAVRNQRQSTGS